MQRLLQAAAQKLQATELDPKGVDGKVGRPVCEVEYGSRIEAFQSRFNISIDGLIEPGSETWQALLQAAGGTQPDAGSTTTPQVGITGSVGR